MTTPDPTPPAVTETSEAARPRCVISGVATPDVAICATSCWQERTYAGPCSASPVPSTSGSEAICAARRCTEPGYVKTESTGLLWCNRHALAYERLSRETDPAPSTAGEPGEESVRYRIGKARAEGYQQGYAQGTMDVSAPSTAGEPGEDVETLRDLTRIVLRQRLIDRNLPVEGRGYMEDERALAACEPVARAIIAAGYLSPTRAAADRARVWDEAIHHVEAWVPADIKRAAMKDNPYREVQS